MLVTVGLVLSTGSPLHARTITSEVDGIRVELTSSPTRLGAKAEAKYVVCLVNRTGNSITRAQLTLRGAMADGMSVVAPLRSAGDAATYRGRRLFTMEGT